MTIGIQGTGTVLATKVVVNMEDIIAQLDPKEAPFTVLLMKLAKQTTDNPKFEWLEDAMAPRWDAINAVAGYADNITDLVVDNSEYFNVGDVVQVPRTKELLLITAIVTATDTLTVRRGYGETAAAAIVDDDPLQIVGNANAEGGLSREINTNAETAAYNYTQIFKTSFGATETLKATKLYGGNDLDYQRKKKGVEHRVDIERAFLFGERKLDTTNYTHPLRMTRGILKHITTNIKDCSGAALTEVMVDDFAEKLFSYGSKSKIVLSPAGLISKISGFAKAKLEIQQGENTYGLAIGTYITPFGTMKLVEHKLLTGTIYSKYAIGVDLQNVKYVNLKGRGTKLETNIQANDQDAEKDQYITEAGLKCKLEKTHAILRNWI